VNNFEIGKGVVMKKIAVAGLVVIASMVLGSSGWAQSAASQQGVTPDLRANSLFTIRGSISGTFTSTPATLPSGACSGGTAGFAAQCATGHTCSCFEDEGAEFTSTVIGKGTAKVFITADRTAGYGLPPVTNPSAGPICEPFIAEFDVTAKNDTQELEAVGGVCPSLPRSNGNTLQFSGGFGAEATTVFTDESASFVLTAPPDGSFKMPFTGLAGTFAPTP
jgi:hypothetical protein